ncbi:MAG TPA: hypothetical protein VG329_03980 [Candidatus Dormibacteraeota bacterium]|jgi:hypothetical protein|nr:hypothetical protein [Candidatus Dormibacteraeota bacterium]
MNDELDIDAEHYEVLKAIREWEDDGTLPAKGASVQALAERMEVRGDADIARLGRTVKHLVEGGLAKATPVPVMGDPFPHYLIEGITLRGGSYF